MNFLLVTANDNMFFWKHILLSLIWAKKFISGMPFAKHTVDFSYHNLFILFYTTSKLQVLLKLIFIFFYGKEHITSHISFSLKNPFLSCMTAMMSRVCCSRLVSIKAWTPSYSTQLYNWPFTSRMAVVAPLLRSSFTILLYPAKNVHVLDILRSETTAFTSQNNNLWRFLLESVLTYQQTSFSLNTTWVLSFTYFC